MSTHSNNIKHINSLHPDVRDNFLGFEKDCSNSGYPIQIYSSNRTWEHQATLYSKFLKDKINNIPAAKPGFSFHNYGFAIDIYVYNKITGKYERNYKLYQDIETIAKKWKIYWLGKDIRKEMHHFDMGGDMSKRKKVIKQLRKNYAAGNLDDNGYVILEDLPKELKKELFSQVWDIKIGSEAISIDTKEKDTKEPEFITKISKIEEQNAVGIWQIVKLVADQYSLSQNINDATISFNQGSLFNFVQKVVQKPWLQFWGETINDQYYFFTRKEPFDYNGWTNLPINKKISDYEVISDDLDWYDGDIFSWHQIIPKGSFLGQQNLIFAYVTAVFFEEYAEIWGSKPNIQVSNYVNFNKITGNNSMLDKALEDLRYMVESNMYLPFSRKGTIIIQGTSSIKRGYKINYLPTGEMFYVDAVSHRYNATDDGIEFTTVLQVSRGMKVEYLIAPENKDTISYFNLINFDNPPPITQRTTKKIKDVAHFFYFDNSRNYLIDMNENFISNDTSSKKMIEQIKDFPSLRKDLDLRNRGSIDLVADYINKHYQAKKFICKGHVDSDGGTSFSILAKQRAETVKSMVISKYLSKYNQFTQSQLENMVSIEFDVSGSKFAAFDDSAQPIDIKDIQSTDNDRKLKIKAYERYTTFKVEPYEEIKEKEVEQKGVNWSVNKKIFQFFINRKQFSNG